MSDGSNLVLRDVTDVALLGPQPVHTLGPVADDWAAIEVWLGMVAANSKSNTGQTLATYRFHLAKLRWYCERELRRPPSTWSVQDVQAFRSYLAALPPSSLPGTLLENGEPVVTPFQKQPAKSSQADILRFTKAMFTALHQSGYLRLNPMGMLKIGKERRVDGKRSIPDDLFDLVLQVIDDTPRTGQKDHQLLLRDRFIFICLRESGLRASELVGAGMDAFATVYEPKSGNTYWKLEVDGATAKGGKARSVPVSPVLLDALIAYRKAFGLDPMPGTDDEPVGLILSVRTRKAEVGQRIKTAADRRFFAAWRDLTTRQGLHEIVKGRVKEAVALLKQTGERAAAAHLARVSSHWLRHTFALGLINNGQHMRTVASALGHASVDTTMGYTEQDTLDQIQRWEAENPGSVAQAPKSLNRAPAMTIRQP